MITIKVKTEAETKGFPIPTNFGDLTFRHYAAIKDADLQKKTLDERLSCRTGIDSDLIALMNFHDAGRLMTVTQFADSDLTLYEQSKRTLKNVRKLNIARDTYGKLEKAKQLINKSERGYYTALIPIIQLYTGQKIGDKLAVTVFAYVVEFNTQFEKFLLKYKRLTEYEPTEDEKEAGIEVLNSFGSFPTIVSLARSMSKTYNEILEMTASEVYTTLLYDFEQSEIQKKMNDIHKRNANLNKKK